MYVYGDEYIAEDLTLENTAGRVGQALSLYAAPARGGFRNVRLLGHQDALSIHEGSVLHFKDCHIDGGVSSPRGSSVLSRPPPSCRASTRDSAQAQPASVHLPYA